MPGLRGVSSNLIAAPIWQSREMAYKKRRLRAAICFFNGKFGVKMADAVALLESDRAVKNEERTQALCCGIA